MNKTGGGITLFKYFFNDFNYCQYYQCVRNLKINQTYTQMKYTTTRVVDLYNRKTKIKNEIVNVSNI